MNENIRRILNECTTPSIDSEWHLPFVDNEKFAKLIIEECIKASTKSWHTLDGYGTTSGQYTAVTLIKEHFGL